MFSRLQVHSVCGKFSWKKFRVDKSELWGVAFEGGRPKCLQAKPEDLPKFPRVRMKTCMGFGAYGICTLLDWLVTTLNISFVKVEYRKVEFSGDFYWLVKPPETKSCL